MNRKITLSILIALFSFNVHGQWAPVGTGMNAVVYAMTSYGGNLYACGNFDQADGNTCNGIAKWNGTAWSSVGGGLQQGPMTYAPFGLLEFGGELYVGGYLDSAGGVPVHKVAKWNGSAWSAVGTNCSIGTVKCFCVHSGSLYAGGNNGVAKWDGTTWTSINTTMVVGALASYGGMLYAGGNFIDANGGDTLHKIARWNGTAWSSVGGGVTAGWLGCIVKTLAVFQGKLYVGGGFSVAGGVSVSHIATWDGSVWAGVGGGVGGNTAMVTALLPAGDKLIVGGTYWTVNSATANRAASWDGTAWTILGTDIASGAGCMAIHNSVLYSGGPLAASGQNYVSKWTGGSYSAVREIQSNEISYVFPNPATDRLIVENNSNVQRFIVTDLTGRAYDCPAGMQGKETILDVSALPNGQYIIADELRELTPRLFIVFR